ncbi:hypothetical protein HBB16_14705 [Pseudonocardia sp. MCCB 268]|nr:hypothetical protein [Pseudonocardia cytotoxica]
MRSLRLAWLLAARPRSGRPPRCAGSGRSPHGSAGRAGRQTVSASPRSKKTTARRGDAGDRDDPPLQAVLEARASGRRWRSVGGPAFHRGSALNGPTATRGGLRSTPAAAGGDARAWKIRALRASRGPEPDVRTGSSATRLNPGCTVSTDLPAGTARARSPNR